MQEKKILNIKRNFSGSSGKSVLEFKFQVNYNKTFINEAHLKTTFFEKRSSSIR